MVKRSWHSQVDSSFKDSCMTCCAPPTPRIFWTLKFKWRIILILLSLCIPYLHIAIRFVAYKQRFKSRQMVQFHSLTSWRPGHTLGIRTLSKRSSTWELFERVTIKNMAHKDKYENINFNEWEFTSIFASCTTQVCSQPQTCRQYMGIRYHSRCKYPSPFARKSCSCARCPSLPAP